MRRRRKRGWQEQQPQTPDSEVAALAAHAAHVQQLRLWLLVIPHAQLDNYDMAQEEDVLAKAGAEI
jgi:hypothetical protein